MPEGVTPVTPSGDGERLLDELRAAIVRYCILPTPEAYDAVTAYIAATYGVPAWECATRLVITSPEKRCGKSRLLDVIEATCYQPLITVNISPAAMVRSISPDPPTILLDEADTVFGKKAADSNEDLRGIVNAGHQRNRPYIRWDVTARAPEKCPTFSMCVLAGIGDMPDTIMDRSVVIRMRRRAPHEKVAPYRRRRDEPVLRELADRVGGWVKEIRPKLAAAAPVMPVEDRAADTWEPLVAIGDAAGEKWGTRIRMACLAMVSGEDDDGSDASLGLRLLADLREVFGDATHLYTTSVLDLLHRLEDAPWNDLFGRQMTAHDLSKRLKPYSVKPVDVRENGGSNKKGYRRDDLFEAWNRYLPRDTRDKGDLPAQPRRGRESDTATEATDLFSVAPVAVSDMESATAPTSNVASVAPVADTCPGCVSPYDSLDHQITCEGLDAS
jgi:hypothetical protein